MSKDMASHATLASTSSDMACDVVIAGCGASGLYTALNLPETLNVIMLSKESLEECDSMLAQGGICVLHDPDDYDAFYEDTMRAGHYENRPESVDIMIRSSRQVIDDLIGYGVRFATDEDGELLYTREAAHSRPRICYHADVTGKEITTKLLAAVQRLPNVTILENTTMTDILEEDGRCCGIIATRGNDATAATDNADGAATVASDNANGAAPSNAADGATASDATFAIRAPYTVMATGGIGGLYDHSTNYPCLTGDACRIAREHGIELEHMDYVQIHPTSLYTGKPGRAFLISESCRGEGAILIDKDGSRFTDELQPRDVVTKAIQAQMQKEGTDHVRLSFENVPKEDIITHFPNIYKKCLEEGYDITKEPIPVCPAQHYFMGGVHVDEDSHTTLPHLDAVGETSCNGVHGANRLASNSLLESLVFGKRAAGCIAEALSA